MTLAEAKDKQEKYNQYRKWWRENVTLNHYQYLARTGEKNGEKETKDSSNRL